MYKYKEKIKLVLSRIKNWYKRGFTLIELLMVVGIVAILATIVMTSLSSARYKAQEAKAKVTIANIEKAIFSLAIDTNQWPNHQEIDCTNTEEGNEVEDLNSEDAGLTQNDSSPAYPGWKGPYIDEIPLDPWGVNYFLDTDYYVDDDDEPCDQNGNTDGCTVVAVIGSLGKNNDGGINDYDGDNIIKIISRNTTCP